MQHDEFDTSEWDEQEDLGPSRTQLKREAEALQKMGTKLLELKQSQFAELPLPDELRRALEQARGMGSNEARRRQLQYVGKLMRRVEIEPIKAALDLFDAGSAIARRQQHRLEEFTSSLLEDESKTLERLLAEYPQTDIQHVRQLVRNARKEQANNKPPSSRRALFRYLRDEVGVR